MYKRGRKPAKVAAAVAGCTLAALAAIGGLAGATPRKATTTDVVAEAEATSTAVDASAEDATVEAASVSTDGSAETDASTDATTDGTTDTAGTEEPASTKGGSKSTSGSTKTNGRKTTSSTTSSTTSTTVAETIESTTTTQPSSGTAEPTTTTSPTTIAPTTTTDTAFVETFQGLPALWADGATVGRWLVQYTGYGTVGVTTVDGAPALVTAPKASTSPGETHAAMITSTDRFGDLDMTLRTKTRRQLRTGSAPNPWEVGWVVWAHERDERFYYAILKPNGWELGKADDTRLDPAGPECTWPGYQNCKYAGAQRFLATGSSPTFPVGQWHDVRIRQIGSRITLWGNGQQLTSFTDNDNPYPSGAVGLYNEDADVAFANLRIERL